MSFSMLISLSQSWWFWVLYLIGALMIYTTSKHKRLSFFIFGDAMVFYIGIGFFMLGMGSSFSFIDLISSSISDAQSGIIDKLLLVFFCFVFYILISKLFKSKQFKFISTWLILFIAGSIANQIILLGGL